MVPVPAVHVSESSGEEVAFIQQTLFVRGAGGFGGRARSELARPCAEPPRRPPDATLSVATSSDQAALYRLNGDLNPLHIDPEFAALGGQSRPILHGLCGLGASVRAVLDLHSTDQAPADLTKVKVSVADESWAPRSECVARALPRLCVRQS